MRSPISNALLLAFLHAILLLGLAAGQEPQNPAPQTTAAGHPLKRLSLEELSEIEVTSVGKKEEKLLTSAASLTVITQEDIRRSGVRAIPEALRLVPGLEVAIFNNGTWAVSTHGFNILSANKMQVFMDGRSLYTPLFGGVFWDVQNTIMADIDRIEVICGPGATLWGGNAVNGVINIITKNAKATQGGLLVAGGGFRERGFTDVRYGGTLGRTAYRVYGNYFNRNSLVLPTGADAKDPHQMGQAGFRTDTDISPADQLTVQGDVYEGDSGILNRPDIATHGGNVLARWTHRFKNQSELQVQAYYDRTGRFVPQQFDEVRNTIDVDLQHHIRLGDRNDVVWGMGYRVSTNRTKVQPVLFFTPTGRQLALFNIFVQDEISLRPDLNLTLGSKFERNDFTGWEIQPTARLAWAASKQQTLWGAISRAVRIPTQFDEDLRIPTTTGSPSLLIRGDSAFQSETLLAYEVGYRYWMTPRFALNVGAYFNDYNRLRSQEFSPTVLPLVLSNKLSGHTFGADIAATFQVLSWWRLTSGYSNLQKNLVLAKDSTDTTKGRQEGFDPRNQFSLRSLMDLPRKIELDFSVRRVSALQLLTPVPVAPYTVFDVRVGWRPMEAVEFSLVGRNLPDRRHVEFGPNGEQVRRSAYAMMTWRF